MYLVRANISLGRRMKIPSTEQKEGKHMCTNSEATLNIIHHKRIHQRHNKRHHEADAAAKEYCKRIKPLDESDTPSDCGSFPGTSTQSILQLFWYSVEQHRKHFGMVRIFKEM